MKTERLHFLDGLRIAALGLLILYHVGMYYVGWGWHVKSPFASTALEPLMRLSSPWRMSLLFLISGAVTALLAARARPGALRSRMARLGLPLLFGMALVVPAQPYFEVVQKLGYGDGFRAFLRLYYSAYGGFCGADGRCLVLPTWNHLWFLPYLMVYTLLWWAVVRWAPAPLARVVAALQARPGAGTLLVAPLLLLAVLRLALRPWFEVTHALVDDPLAHAMYLPAFAIGALWALTPGAWAAVARLRWPALAAALAAWVTAVWGEATPLPLLRLAFVVQQWCGVLAAVGFGVRHLDRDGPWRRRLSAWVFPVYLFHQSLIIGLAMALRPLALAPAVEGPLLVSGTLAGALALTLLLGRWAPLRPWLGLAGAPQRARPAPAPRARPQRARGPASPPSR